MYRVYTYKEGLIKTYMDFETEKEAEEYGKSQWAIYWIEKL